MGTDGLEIGGGEEVEAPEELATVETLMHDDEVEVDEASEELLVLVLVRHTTEHVRSNILDRPG